MTQSVPFDAYLGASKTGQAIGCIVYQLNGSTVYSAFSTTGWYEAPSGSGAFHHAGLTLPDAGGVVAVGVSGTEYIRSAVGPAASSGGATAADVWDYANVEPASVPASNASVGAILGWLFALARNRITQTATQQTLYADNGTSVIGTSAQGSDLHTYTRQEWQ